MENETDFKRISKVLNSPKMIRDYFDHCFFNSSINEKVLYIHIPYCMRKCRYCVCQSNVLTRREELSKHIQKVLSPQLEEYADALNKKCVDQLYIGGGTPTILTPEELEDVFNLIPNFEKIPLKCIEASPETLSDEHIDLFAKKGFTFVSIGVQSLNKVICTKQNRFYVTRDELETLSKKMLSTGIYFNYDLICFMDKGDIRDLPQFYKELLFIMQKCRPSSITIHQLRQVMFTCEKTEMLMDCIKRAINNSEGYQCVNSMLEKEDVYNDTVYQAEYRIACRDYSFTHYMWNKYAALPVKGYDILSLGYTNRFHTISSAGPLFYSPGENKLKWVNYDQFIYDDYERIRERKGFIH